MLSVVGHNTVNAQKSNIVKVYRHHYNEIPLKMMKNAFHCLEFFGHAEKTA